MTSGEPMSVHMPVLNLLVPRLWRVGRVTFRPRGWLRRRVAKLGEGAEGTRRWFYDEAQVPLREWRWATAEVTMPTDAHGAADFDASRDAIRDAIAVLRLYQRAVVPLDHMDIQTFGLVADIGSDLAYSWQTTGDRLARYGRNMLGVLGEWAFTRAHVDAFLTRPAFAYLDAALRIDEVTRTAWQRRAIASIRALNVATAMLRQPLRVTLQAVALEALLGDDPDPSGGGSQPGASRRPASGIPDVRGRRHLIGDGRLSLQVPYRFVRDAARQDHGCW